MKIKLLIFSLFILIPGCDLNEEILDEVSGDRLVKEPNAESHFAASAYMHMAGGFNWWNDGAVRLLNDIVSDELIIPTRGADWDNDGIPRQLHAHAWTPENAQITNTWNWADQGAGKANTGLYFLGQMDATEEIEQFKAELRFFRVFFRFWQYDLFRQVPFRSEDDLKFIEDPEVIAGKDAFDWLVDELIDVIPRLKDRNATPYGRVTRAAAQMLLAKLYLNAEAYIGTAMWSEALEKCTQIISTEQYSINPDYFGIFGVNNDDNSEAILVVRRDRTTPILWFIHHWRASLHYSTPIAGGGWNGPAVVPDFMYTWDLDGDPVNGVSTTDKRFYDDRIKAQTGTNLGFVMGPQFMPDGSPIQDIQRSQDQGEFVQLDHTIEVGLIGVKEHEGVRVIKYEPDFLASIPGFLDGNDYMVFRYADLWLMTAEAEFRLGNTGEALDNINILRGIRGVPALTSLTEQDILNERGFELYWEGWRRQDLVRFHQFTRPWAHKPQTENYREVFPIPATALASNKNLNQNPGY